MRRFGSAWRELVTKSFPALSIRNFRLYIIGRASSMMGMWIQSPVIPWLVYQLTGSNAALGTVHFLGQLPMTLFVVFAGVFADRHSRRNLVVITQSAMMVAAFAMGAAAAFGLLDLRILYAFALVNGVFRALDVPSRQAFMIDLAGTRYLGNAIALRSAAFNMARAVGPAIGGYLLAAYGPGICFFTKGALFIPVLAVLVSLKGLTQGTARATTRGLRDLGEGIRYVWASREIFAVLSLWSLFSMFGVWYGVLLPAFAKTVYKTEAGEYGLIISAQGVGAIIAALAMAATSRKRSPQRWAIAGLCLVVVGLFALSINSTYIIAMPCVALYGFGWVSFTVSCDTLIQHLTEDRFRGRVMGLRTFVFGGLGALGALPAGFIASIAAVGPKKTVAIGAAVVAAAVAILGPKILKIDLNAVDAVPADSSVENNTTQ